MAVRTAAGAVIGVVMSITMPWHEHTVDRAGVERMFAEIDQAMGLLEAGLPL
jgi:hypothetical protein